MSDANSLWAEAYEAFTWHQPHLPDPTEQMALDRLAWKCTRESFNPDTCDIHEETLSLEALKQLEVYSKDDTVADKPDKEPIVVLLYKGRRLVIDGRRRVNRWIEQKDHTPRRALIITPKSG
jgi:hypothetical protein